MKRIKKDLQNKLKILGELSRNIRRKKDQAAVCVQLRIVEHLVELYLRTGFTNNEIHKYHHFDDCARNCVHFKEEKNTFFINALVINCKEVASIRGQCYCKTRDRHETSKDDSHEKPHPVKSEG